MNIININKKFIFDNKQKIIVVIKLIEKKIVKIVFYIKNVVDYKRTIFFVK